MIELRPQLRAVATALALGAVLALGASLSGCLFDKPEERVDLVLTKVPAEVDRIRIVAVDFADTSKVLAVVHSSDWTPGSQTSFSLGKASGKDWLLKVEGYQDDYLVYCTLIPSGKRGYTEPVPVHVSATWPAVFFTSVRRDGDSVRFATAFRNQPKETHWHINLGADSLGDSLFTPVYTSGIALAASSIDPGSLITADLRIPDGHHSRFPVQEPDTLLADEALNPAGSSVTIADAFTRNDSVHLVLTYANFRAPTVDEPRPGQGFPKVYEGGTMRPLPEFVQGSSANIGSLTAPVYVVQDLKSLVVALSYANGLRIRPAVADTVSGEKARSPQVLLPSFTIESWSIEGTSLRLVFSRRNMAGYHLHAYRNRVQWPPQASVPYNLCHDATCDVEEAVWKGATKVMVAVHEDDHDLVTPVIVDSVIAPVAP